MVNPDFFGMGPDGPMVGGAKCRSCGRVYFPKKTICVDCWQKGNMDVMPLSRRGKLSLFTIATMSLLGVDTPYACGYVDLPEGVRLISPKETVLVTCNVPTVRAVEAPAVAAAAGEPTAPELIREKKPEEESDESS